MSETPDESKALQDEIGRREALDGMKAKLVKLGDELAAKAPQNFATQLSLAQEVAAREAVPEVITNFLTYQAAKAGKRDPGWRHDNLYGLAAKHIDAIAKESGGDRKVQQRAIAHYFGYARRSYIAREKLTRRDR